MRISTLLSVSVLAIGLAACTPTPTPSTEVVITSPAAKETVSSPLVVKGRARGPWFFEASLPVMLTDSEGNVIVRQSAQAKGEWMTTDFVEFETTLTFTTTATSGYLVIRKDNPSGLPENDGEFKIPVSF